MSQLAEITAAERNEVLPLTREFHFQRGKKTLDTIDKRNSFPKIESQQSLGQENPSRTQTV